jgi:hypothetical protein
MFSVSPPRAKLQAVMEGGRDFLVLALGVAPGAGLTGIWVVPKVEPQGTWDAWFIPLLKPGLPMSPAGAPSPLRFPGFWPCLLRSKKCGPQQPSCRPRARC